MAISLIDLFTRKTSVLLNVDEDIVHKLNMFQWKSAKEGLHEHNEVEISGLCKIKFRPKKAIDKLKHLGLIYRSYERKMNNGKEDLYRETTERRFASVGAEIDYLLKKLINE